jgi:hypothetical protein
MHPTGGVGMKAPYKRDDPSLSSIGAFKGVVLTDERRHTLHDYRDLGEELTDDD